MPLSTFANGFICKNCNIIETKISQLKRRPWEAMMAENVKFLLAIPFSGKAVWV